MGAASGAPTWTRSPAGGTPSLGGRERLVFINQSLILSTLSSQFSELALASRTTPAPGSVANACRLSSYFSFCGEGDGTRNNPGVVLSS